MSRIVTAVIAAVIILFFSGCAHDSSSVTDLDSTACSSDKIIATSGTEMTSETETGMQTSQSSAVRVGDGIFEVSAVPELEKMLYSGSAEKPSAQACVYGTSYYGGSMEAFGQTVRFEDIPHADDDHTVYYCICKEPAVVYYTANYGRDLYRADYALKTPELILTGDHGASDCLGFRQIIAFPDTELLFVQCFGVSGGSDGCRIGSLDPKTGETDLTSCDWCTAVPCSTGVMLYTDSGKDRTTVFYWENGTLRRIQLQNAKEATGSVFISDNGRYLCTEKAAQTKDGKWLTRYSVYDVKSGSFLRSFDWTFDRLGTAWDGFYLSGVSEETQSLYLINRTDSHMYQFQFGDTDYADGD